jgi:hypothetical protein
MKFSDLVFKKNQSGIRALISFDNGWQVSVVAGVGMYSTPKENLSEADKFSSFEVAIFNENGDFATKDLFQADDDVVGWCGRDDIDDIIAMVANQ